MLHYINVLSTNLLQKINEQKNNNLDKNVWRLSELFWKDYLQYGVSHSCATFHVTPDLVGELEEELRDKLPSFNRLWVQYCIWLRGAGISTHTDAAHGFGATIYLNEIWDINYGGVFLWQPKDTTEWKAVVPEYNTMMVNYEGEKHLVTPVTATSPNLRYTLQIWLRD